MKVIVEGWTFSTSEQCHECGAIPYDDSWQMAKVNGNWICISCLGTMANRYESKYAGIKYGKQSSKRKIFDKAAAEKSMVFAFHFPFPSLGYVNKKGNGWQWQPI